MFCFSNHMPYRLSGMFTLPLNFTKSMKISKALTCFKSGSVARSSSSLSYCVDLVKKFDYENYLCTLLLPDHLRASAFAIRAFNIELSRIQDQVSESQIIPIRFQFWEDRLDDIYNDKIVNHPVVTALANTVRKHKLSKIFLKRLLTIRAKQSSKSTFKNMDEMEKYAEQTNSPVYMLLLEASGLKNVDCDHVAAHLGTAQGITNLLRSVPFNLKEQLILLPMSLLVKYNISEESILRMNVKESTLSDIFYDVSVVAEGHLRVAQSLKDKIPSDRRSIFLPAVPVASYLKKLQSCNFNVFDSKLHRTNGFMPIILYWKKFRNVF